MHKNQIKRSQHLFTLKFTQFDPFIQNLSAFNLNGAYERTVCFLLVYIITNTGGLPDQMSPWI